jgi:hypothetical protein
MNTLDSIAMVVGYASMFTFAAILAYVILNELRIVMKDKGDAK